MGMNGKKHSAEQSLLAMELLRELAGMDGAKGNDNLHGLIGRLLRARFPMISEAKDGGQAEESPLAGVEGLDEDWMMEDG